MKSLYDNFKSFSVVLICDRALQYIVNTLDTATHSPRYFGHIDINRKVIVRYSLFRLDKTCCYSLSENTPAC